MVGFSVSPKNKTISLLVILFLMFLFNGRHNSVKAGSCTGSWQCVAKENGICTTTRDSGGSCGGNSDQTSCNNFSPNCNSNECTQGGCVWSTSTSPYCGDGSCNNGETCSTCPSDCGTCGGGTPPPITCSPACTPSFPYCCSGSCSANPCNPQPPGPKPAQCSGITVQGVTPGSDGTYTLNKNQTYTLTVNYNWPTAWGTNNQWLTGSVVYNPLVCTPVNSSTRANRAASNRVLIGKTQTPPLWESNRM